MQYHCSLDSTQQTTSRPLRAQAPQTTNDPAQETWDLDVQTKTIYDSARNALVFNPEIPVVKIWQHGALTDIELHPGGLPSGDRYR